MELTEKKYEQIEEAFPRQRRQAEVSNLDVLNAALYMLENGGACPKNTAIGIQFMSG